MSAYLAAIAVIVLATGIWLLAVAGWPQGSVVISLIIVALVFWRAVPRSRDDEPRV